MATRSPFALDGLSDTFAALADPTRRAMVQMLGQGQKPVGELAAAFELSAPAISKHLRVLRQCHLVYEQRDAGDARLRVYRLRLEPLNDLDAWLGHMRAFWAIQLDAFAAHVAARQSGSSTRQAKQPTRKTSEKLDPKRKHAIATRSQRGPGRSA